MPSNATAEFRRYFEATNDAYKSCFPSGHLPARTCIGVTGLARDAVVEIDMMARRP
ncbi:MAG: RidA family protein [Proteobacteria bacterium]|nr:RidA family protein [Pseudomonadota bacterium]